MDVHVADHPLIAHKLTYLRDKRTDSPTFRRLAEELMTLLAYEATRDVRVEPFEIETPVAPTTGIKLSNPKPLIVPILRAGLGMLDGMVKLLPSAEVGFLGMIRNEETLEVITYANRLPDDLTGRQVFILDPMLATGGTLVDAIDFLTAKGAETSPPSACSPPPRASSTSRTSSPKPHSRSSSCSARSTRGSTRRATSSPAWATPATGSTASSEPLHVCRSAGLADLLGPSARYRPTQVRQCVAPRRIASASVALARLLRDDLSARRAVRPADLELDESLALQGMSEDPCRRGSAAGNS